MLYLDDIIKNLEKEQEYIEYEYDLNDICNEYNESHLMLYETGNRMSGAGGVFFLRQYENAPFQCVRKAPQSAREAVTYVRLYVRTPQSEDLRREVAHKPNRFRPDLL